MWPIHKAVQYFVSPYTQAEHTQTKFHSSYHPYYVKKKDENPQNIDFTGEAKRKNG